MADFPAVVKSAYRYAIVMWSRFGNDSACRFCPELFLCYSRIGVTYVGAVWARDAGSLTLPRVELLTYAYARRRNDLIPEWRGDPVADYAVRSHQRPAKRRYPPGWGTGIPRGILSR